MDAKRPGLRYASIGRALNWIVPIGGRSLQDPLLCRSRQDLADDQGALAEALEHAFKSALQP
jgi:hypothetical protein